MFYDCDNAKQNKKKMKNNNTLRKQQKYVIRTPKHFWMNAAQTTFDSNLFSESTLGRKREALISTLHLRKHLYFSFHVLLHLVNLLFSFQLV